MTFFPRSLRVPALILLVLFVLYLLLFLPPRDFPQGAQVVVASGEPLSKVADELGRAKIVQHPSLLILLLRLTSAARSVQAGTYAFEKPQNVVTVAYRLAVGKYDLAPVRITFPEGSTVREMGLVVAREFPHITAEAFIAAAKGNEGYLFPDTYLFLPTVEVETIVKTMEDTFAEKIASLEDDLTASGHSLSDVITMASLVEKEGRSTEVRQVIAGILWNRLERGMPLQVDAVFGYIFNRDTYSPTYADLKVDSPYNTYAHKGLPPGPINNPGIDSIRATLHPTATKYLYYLVDRNGEIHYAVTYVEHQKNQKLYLQ